MKKRPTVAVLLLAACGILSACSAGGAPKGAPPDSLVAALADSIARARQDSVNRAQPGYIVDSILPPAEALRRFTADLNPRPNEFSNGAGSRDALVKKWVRSLESNDSLTLIRTALTRPEFAYLVYPTLPSGVRREGTGGDSLEPERARPRERERLGVGPRRPE